MKISYDYSDLIAELKDEIATGDLAYNEIIQVRREDRGIPNYTPIIDYYYNADRMALIVADDPFDDEQERAEVAALKEDYEKYKDQLRPITVKDALAEMEEWNRIV